MRKVWEAEAARRRALVEKEGGGVRARGSVGGEAGVESGQGGEACGGVRRGSGPGWGRRRTWRVHVV